VTVQSQAVRRFPGKSPAWVDPPLLVDRPGLVVPQEENPTPTGAGLPHLVQRPYYIWPHSCRGEDPTPRCRQCDVRSSPRASPRRIGVRYSKVRAVHLFSF